MGNNLSEIDLKERIRVRKFVPLIDLQTIKGGKINECGHILYETPICVNFCTTGYDDLSNMIIKADKDDVWYKPHYEHTLGALLNIGGEQCVVDKNSKCLPRVGLSQSQYEFLYGHK